MVGIIIILSCVALGVLSGLNIIVPYALSKYIAVAILAFLDSAFGGMTANLQKKFNLKVFLTGFFGNAIIAMVLVFIGIRLNVDIYLAAVIVFSTRLLNNFSVIRRIVIDKVDKDKPYDEEYAKTDYDYANRNKKTKTKNLLEKLDKKSIDIKKQ